MTMEKFRMMHSLLIEHYQYIEHHLEGIYALLCGKSFLAGLEEVETSTINRLIQEIKRLEHENGVSIISVSDYEKLEYIRKRRNFWCHNCYVDMVVDVKTGNPKSADFIKTLIADVRDAEQLRENLFQIKRMNMANHPIELP